jgi:hypothetical protein
MGSEYLWGQNPMQDTLLQMIALGVDVSDKQFKEELNTIFTMILENLLKSREDLVYLDFKIKRTDTQFQVIGNNIISALWLSGILPKNPTAVYSNNECHIADTIYTFDKRKKILIKTIKK